VYYFFTWERLPRCGEQRHPHPKHSQIWQTDLAQIWLTYGKPVPAWQPENRSGPDLVHLRQAGSGMTTRKQIWLRSGSLTASRQAIELPESGRVGWLPGTLISHICPLCHRVNLAKIFFGHCSLALVQRIRQRFSLTRWQGPALELTRTVRGTALRALNCSQNKLNYVATHINKGSYASFNVVSELLAHPHWLSVVVCWVPTWHGSSDMTWFVFCSK